MHLAGQQPAPVAEQSQQEETAPEQEPDEASRVHQLIAKQSGGAASLGKLLFYVMETCTKALTYPLAGLLVL